jgi:hypothetical protein
VTSSRPAFDAARGTALVVIMLVSACAHRSASDTAKECVAMDPTDVRHISVAINRSAREVYDFASKPKNLPRWARGLAESIENVGDEWVAKSPMGRLRVRFVEPNAFGVLDHDVTLESGVSVHNPMRVVVRAGGRSEVIFTLFRRPDVSDAEFEADARAVEKDLRALKELLNAGEVPFE